MNKTNIAKKIGVIIACGIAAVMAVGETLGGIKTDEKLESLESRLAALELNNKES